MIVSKKISYGFSAVLLLLLAGSLYQAWWLIHFTDMHMSEAVGEGFLRTGTAIVNCVGTVLGLFLYALMGIVAPLFNRDAWPYSILAILVLTALTAIAIKKALPKWRKLSLGIFFLLWLLYGLVAAVYFIGG